MNNKHTRILIIGALSVLGAFAQTGPAAPTGAAEAEADFSALPSITMGAGMSWTRGGTSPYAMDVTVGIHIGTGNWYSWSDISTPLATAPSSTPVVSSMTTGGAWIPVMSVSRRVIPLFIVQAGFSNLQATSTLAPAFTGTAAVAFRLSKKANIYLMPYAKASNATTATGSNALATAVFQPGVQLIYGFGGK